MTLLSPPDICRLGATNRYWRDVVRDPLLWRYFLQRDMPHWSSIDHVSMPQLQALAGPMCSENAKINLDDVEDCDQGKEPIHDYMAEWVQTPIDIFPYWNSDLSWVYRCCSWLLRYPFVSDIQSSVSVFVLTDTWKAAQHTGKDGVPCVLRMRQWHHSFSLWYHHLSHAMPCLGLAWSSWMSLWWPG